MAEMTIVETRATEWHCEVAWAGMISSLNWPKNSAEANELADYVGQLKGIQTQVWAEYEYKCPNCDRWHDSKEDALRCDWEMECPGCKEE